MKRVLAQVKRVQEDLNTFGEITRQALHTMFGLIQNIGIRMTEYGVRIKLPRYLLLPASSCRKLRAMNLRNRMSGGSDLRFKDGLLRAVLPPDS